jgi:hypothetical protein
MNTWKSCCKYQEEITVTFKRGSFKRSVKDDFAFLWEQAIFGPSPNQNPVSSQHEILRY